MSKNPGERVTLYPHAGEREWSTVMHDEWKRDMGVEYVLAAEVERLRKALEAEKTGRDEAEMRAQERAAEVARLRETAQAVVDAHRAIIEGVTPQHPNWCADDREEYDARFSAWHAVCRDLREALEDEPTEPILQLSAEEAAMLLDSQASVIDIIERMPVPTRANYQQGPWWDGILKLRKIAGRAPAELGPMVVCRVCGASVDINAPSSNGWTFTTETGWLCPDHRDA